MVYLLWLLVGSVITWVLLMGAMLLVQRLADLGIPSLGDFLWKTAVVAASVNATDVLLGSALPIEGIMASCIGNLAAFIVFLVLMRKFFEMEWWQTFVVVIASRVLGFVAMMAVLKIFG